MKCRELQTNYGFCLVIEQTAGTVCQYEIQAMRYRDDLTDSVSACMMLAFWPWGYHTSIINYHKCPKWSLQSPGDLKKEAWSTQKIGPYLRKHLCTLNFNYFRGIYLNVVIEEFFMIHVLTHNRHSVNICALRELDFVIFPQISCVAFENAF